MSNVDSTNARPQAAASPRNEGTPGNGVASSSGSSPELQDDQPTIISDRLPIPPDSSSGPASANRILQGKILSGDRLGLFELVEFVGGGGMGRVFRALDTRLCRTVALKILSPEQAADRETLLRFHNEAQSAARLNHDNIVQVYFVGEDRGLHYIVFEFIEGVNARRLVQEKGPLPLAEAVNYTLQAADALTHAASRNVVHRDIKPSNLLITPEGQIKLIDMGLARLREAESSAADLTASGVTLGTFDYISPEQARDPRNADVRSDLYSLGCTFFYMLTARPPFPEGTVLQKLLQHQGDQPPDVRQFRPDLPEGVTRILRKMLAKDPRHRYADPSELVSDLLWLANEVGLRPTLPRGKVWTAPRQPVRLFLHQHLPWIIPTVALVFIVLLLDFLWSPGRHSDDHPPPVVPSVPEGQPVPMLPDPKAFEAGLPEKIAAKPATLSGAEKPAGPTSLLRSKPWIEPLEKSPGKSEPSNVPAMPDALQRPRGTGPVDSGTEGKSPGGILPGPPLPRTKPAALPSAAGGAPEKEPPATPGKTARVLVVRPLGPGQGEFPSLGAACGAAVPGDEIELQFDGRFEEQPILLTDKEIVVRAAAGRHPIVVFRAAALDRVHYPQGMLTATGGRLAMTSIALELHVAEVLSGHWALLELRGEQSVRLERCSLTVYGDAASTSAGRDAAFFRVRAAPGAEAGPRDGGPALPRVTAIQLTDCCARGEATFLRAEQLQPVRLTWTNGLLATSERLLWVLGGERTPQAREKIQVDLDHVTAMARGGLCCLTDGQDGTRHLSVEVRCLNSILIGSSGVAMVQQTGHDKAEDLRQQFSWNGERNCYEFDALWTIHGRNPQSPKDLTMDFDEWKEYWRSQEYHPLRNVEWSRPAADRPSRWHDQTPEDYALSPVADNPGLTRGPDGRVRGLLADRLPGFPPGPGTRPAEKPVAERPVSEKPAAEKPAAEKSLPAKAAEPDWNDPTSAPGLGFRW